MTVAAGNIETLDNMDVMGSVNGKLLPITIYSGANVSIVTEEFVKSSDFDGNTLKFKGILAGYQWTKQG